MAQDRAVLYNGTNWNWTDLGVLPGYSAPSGPFWHDPTGTLYSAGGAYGISTSGTIALTAGDYLPATYSSGVISEVPGLPGPPNQGEAFAISPDGSKIGGYSGCQLGTCQQSRAFLYDGSVHYVTTGPGVLFAVNNSGTAAGWFSVGGGVGWHAFTYASAMLRDITSRKW